MHGPPLTTDEIAALVSRQVADLRGLGASLDRAARVVAKRHNVPLATVTRLLRRHHTLTERQRHIGSAAA